MPSACQRLYQIEQIRQLEKLAMKEQGLSEQQLMEEAGRSVCQFLLYYWPDARYFVVLCGKGNNAGDGYTVAKYLLQRGRNVKVLEVDNNTQLHGAARQAYDHYIKAEGEIVPFEPEHLEGADVAVDAMLGIGLKGQVREPFRQIIHQLNQCRRPVLAIDGPSGLDADTGNPMGLAVQASVTISMIGGKTGFYTGPGLSHCGHVHCVDLGVKEKIYERVAPYAWLMTEQQTRQYLPPRPRHSHKGDFGHIMVVGGDLGMAGAVRMAGEATLRAGGGLVKIATHKQHLHVVSAQRPELMCSACESEKDLNELSQWCDVLAIGPGLGQSDWSWQIFETAMKNNKPKVIDADGLNLLARIEQSKLHDYLQGDYILTPHPGEAARLLNSTPKEIQKDRFAAVKDLQKRYGGTVVLKGAGSLITDGEVLSLVNTGNPGMSTAGVGDVLTGILAGMLGQGLPSMPAAQCGVFCHGHAADIAANEYERGLMALDIADALPRAVNPQQYRMKGAYE